MDQKGQILAELLVAIAVGALRTPRLGRGNLVPGLVVLGIIAAGLFLAGRMVGFF